MGRYIAKVLVCNKIGISLLFLKNSSLNCINRCDPQISPTELQLEFRSTRYSTNSYFKYNNFSQNYARQQPPKILSVFKFMGNFSIPKVIMTGLIQLTVYKTGNISVLVVDQHKGIIYRKKIHYCRYNFYRNFEKFLFFIFSYSSSENFFSKNKNVGEYGPRDITS